MKYKKYLEQILLQKQIEMYRDTNPQNYEPRVMKKEKRRVKRERKNSYVDEDGVYHAHESS